MNQSRFLDLETRHCVSYYFFLLLAFDLEAFFFAVLAFAFVVFFLLDPNAFDQLSEYFLDVPDRRIVIVCLD